MGLAEGKPGHEQLLRHFPDKDHSHDHCGGHASDNHNWLPGALSLLDVIELCRGEAIVVIEQSADKGSITYSLHKNVTLHRSALRTVSPGLTLHGQEVVAQFIHGSAGNDRP
jgi:hypothetical protein